MRLSLPLLPMMWKKHSIIFGGFGQNSPKAGHATIFDRSWYGRVLVERVEGFCSEDDWKRAYREINEMEENFHHFGTAIVKFWIHIDQDEQLRRFEANAKKIPKNNGSYTRDRRNREKWKPYEEAVEEMFLRTHTKYAPWTVIEGNCKRFARIKALDVTIAAIEKKIAQEIQIDPRRLFFLVPAKRIKLIICEPVIL